MLEETGNEDSLIINYNKIWYNKIMNDDKILELTGKIEETLGKDDFATISDTIGEILTGNAENMKQLADKDAEIAKLKDRNEKLVSANGALLQKVPVGVQKSEETAEEKDKTPVRISMKDAFDKNGNFIH